MAVGPELTKAILGELGISQRTLNRRVAELRASHGPMSGDEARLIIAHEAGISLTKHSISAEAQDRVRTLRAAGTISRQISKSSAKNTGGNDTRNTSGVPEPPTKPATTANRFDGRDLHSIIVTRARKPFVNGLRQDAVLRAFRSVNNRVKQLTETSRDGASLMTWAFSESAPQLQLSPLASESEKNEHNGVRYLMQGAMLGLRNPRAHEDHWPRDDDEALALDALSMASLLHRMLDLSEMHASDA